MMNIDDKHRQKALLLFYGGNNLHTVYSTLTDDPTKDFVAASKKLSDYFKPKLNLTFETYSFKKRFNWRMVA